MIQVALGSPHISVSMKEDVSQEERAYDSPPVTVV